MDLSHKIVAAWFGYRYGALDQTEFIRILDDLVTEQETPADRLIELSAAYARGLHDDDVERLICAYCPKRDDPEFKYGVINEMHRNHSLNSHQAASALVHEFVNDELGVLESPDETLNLIYNSDHSFDDDREIRVHRHLESENSFD